MCGLFGFDGVAAPDPTKLRVVAEAASRRGPHACGVAWDSEGAVQVERRAGPWRTHAAELLRACSSAIRIVGHFRLSTSGNWRDLANNQPLHFGGCAVAHNGNIQGWRERAERLGLKLTTSCDSELVARVLDASREFAPIALNEAGLANIPHAVLALRTNAFFATRRMLPLFAWITPEGTYYSSVQPHTDALPLPEPI